MTAPNRRQFIQTTAAATAVTAALPTATRAAANERVRIGQIGCGGQGRNGHLGGYRGIPHAEVVYVCDPDAARRAEAAKAAPGAKPVEDLRRILEDKSVDAVSIATPDHWHVPAALLALDAGKHVYIEKPCSHNFREGQLLVAAAKKSGKVVQHGTQMRSNQGYIDAMTMLREGIIGDVMIARAWNIQRRSDIGKAKPSQPPANFDYDMWVGPAPMIPFQSNRHHYNWHWWRHFGTGDTGNDGVHELDLARWGLGVETHPSSVAVLGGKYFFDDDQEFPDTMTATFEYGGSGPVGSKRQLVFEMRLWSTNYPYNVDGGVEYWGTKGKMFISRRGKFELWGERNKRKDEKPSRTPEMNVRNNQLAFLRAIREDVSATADAKTAHQSAALCHLANISAGLGRSFQFDPGKEVVVGDNDAQGLLKRTYREHWAAPAV